LNVAVLNDIGRSMDIRRQHEGVSGSRVDAVGSPGAAHRSISECIVSGVVGEGNDQLPVLPVNLFEQFPLQELHIYYGERTPAALRRKYVPISDRYFQPVRLYLRPGKQRVP